MKTGYQWVLWLALIISVITSVAHVLALTDLSLFISFPVPYLASLATMTGGLVLMIRIYIFPYAKRLRLQGKLLVSPLLLLLLSVPAALANIYFDLTGEEILELITVLLASLSAVSFFVALFIFTIPGFAILLQFFSDNGDSSISVRRLTFYSAVALTAFSLLAVFSTVIAGVNTSAFLISLPFLALFQVILHIIIAFEFRTKIREWSVRHVAKKEQSAVSNNERRKANGLRSIVYFHSDYLDIISGRLDYLVNYADDSYASVIVQVASRTYDPALIPALNIIVNGMRFGESVRHEAAIVQYNIEGYYSDPVRNRDVLRRPGISEGAASARAILVNRRVPQPAEILKLLNDTNPEIRKIGLAAAGRFGIIQLREEVLHTLTNTETGREAFYLLLHWGPDIYEDILINAIKPQENEKVSMMVIRLLSLMPPSKAVPHMNHLMINAPVTVRLEAVKYLKDSGLALDDFYRKKVIESISRTIYNLARIVAFRIIAEEKRYFVLCRALGWEWGVYNELLFGLLSLLYGVSCAAMIRDYTGKETVSGALMAAEVIHSTIPGPLRKPLSALLGNNTDLTRLRELAYCFPLREVTGKTLLHGILAADQNITGLWVKACALHCVAEEKKGTEKEVIVSYLFSNSHLLQQEAARVIRAIDHLWYSEAEERLSDQVRQNARALIDGKTHEMATIFEKTRFLSLCFQKIPEERIIHLASGMRYSESYDAGPSPGNLTWIVPSGNGKSGLYSLPVTDITDFVFHYSEYTDIFVNYMDDQGNDHTQ